MEPREYASDMTRSGFGRQETLEWRIQTGPSTNAEMLSAWIQHRVAYELRSFLRGPALRSSPSALADELHTPKDNLLRKFRGEVSATLAELIMWCGAVGRMDILVEALSDLAKGSLPNAPADIDGTRPEHKIERVDGLRMPPDPPSAQ